jgi:hypothetical protein
MSTDWTIQGRTDRCSATGELFVPGQHFYTVLFDEISGFRREDFCETAWKERRKQESKPYSFWRTKFEPPPPPAPEALGKQTAEDLLRRYTSQNAPEHGNVRYILALMLERKRLLKEVDVKEAEDGSLTRIYQHAKSGDVFIIPDPGLRLDQMAEVQTQVAELLK